MGISASFNLDDASLKQTLPSTPDTGNIDDMNMFMSTTSNLTEESAGELQGNLTFPKTKKLFKGQTGDTRSKLQLTQDASSLSAEEKHDLEELQKDVLLEDECEILLPRTSPAVAQAAHRTDCVSNADTVDPGQSLPVPIHTLSAGLASASSGKRMSTSQSVSTIMQCKFAYSDSDDLNDFNVTQFREVNSRSKQLDIP